ncbi:myb-like protein X [Mytilus californianus]|uniref:myb-like protein X n=1 Tax=Mytilus californianus TaxID=6549 RepID=UPI0022468103|nr:myb-like protein X [Mytilus californianus]XP_052087636.1 myb-like protein X [Mytilus californianus]XP_052087637.1 myb-like protein X [Mytilus californianus]
MGNETSKKSKKSYAFEIIDERDELNPEDVKQIVASEADNAICSIETNTKLKNEPPLPDTSPTELDDNKGLEEPENINTHHSENEQKENSPHSNEKSKENETGNNVTELVDTIPIETDTATVVHSKLSCQNAEAAEKLTSEEVNHENQNTGECTSGEIKDEENIRIKEKKKSKKEKDFTKRKESKKREKLSKKEKRVSKKVSLKEGKETSNMIVNENYANVNYIPCQDTIGFAKHKDDGDKFQDEVNKENANDSADISQVQTQFGNSSVLASMVTIITEQSDEIKNIDEQREKIHDDKLDATLSPTISSTDTSTTIDGKMDMNRKWSEQNSEVPHNSSVEEENNLDSNINIKIESPSKEDKNYLQEAFDLIDAAQSSIPSTTAENNETTHGDGDPKADITLSARIRRESQTILGESVIDHTISDESYKISNAEDNQLKTSDTDNNGTAQIHPELPQNVVNRIFNNNNNTITEVVSNGDSVNITITTINNLSDGVDDTVVLSHVASTMNNNQNESVNETIVLNPSTSTINSNSIVSDDTETTDRRVSDQSSIIKEPKETGRSYESENAKLDTDISSVATEESLKIIPTDNQNKTINENNPDDQILVTENDVSESKNGNDDSDINILKKSPMVLDKSDEFERKKNKKQKEEEKKKQKENKKKQKSTKKKAKTDKEKVVDESNLETPVSNQILNSFCEETDENSIKSQKETSTSRENGDKKLKITLSKSSSKSDDEKKKKKKKEKKGKGKTITPSLVETQREIPIANKGIFDDVPIEIEVNDEDVVSLSSLSSDETDTSKCTDDKEITLKGNSKETKTDSHLLSVNEANTRPKSDEYVTLSVIKNNKENPTVKTQQAQIEDTSEIIESPLNNANNEVTKPDVLNDIPKTPEITSDISTSDSPTFAESENSNQKIKSNKESKKKKRGSKLLLFRNNSDVSKVEKDIATQEVSFEQDPTTDLPKERRRSFSEFLRPVFGNIFSKTSSTSSTKTKQKRTASIEDQQPIEQKDTGSKE